MGELDGGEEGGGDVVWVLVVTDEVVQARD